MFNRICGHGKGWCFTPTDFLDLGSRQAIDTALSRLTKSGRIRRLSRGLYDFPRTHAHLGSLSPAPEVVARALARKDNLQLQPTGAYAANLLGLTTQVPAKIVFLTNGPSRSVAIGNQEIALKSVAPRFMAAAGRTSGTVIQALRHLGRSHVTPEMVARLRKILGPAEKRQLVKDRPTAPAWMHPILLKIAAEEESLE